MKANNSIAVIIANMGGPDSLDQVEPYLTNIFSDPEIIDLPMPNFLRQRFARWLAHKRTAESQEIYKQIGGRSPLLDILKQQAQKIEFGLNQKENGKFNVFVAMRYWHPLIEEVWQQLIKEQYNNIIVLSLFSFYSTATSGSITKLVQQLINETKIDAKTVSIIDRFGDHHLFVKAMTDQIQKKLQGRSTPVDILMSVHGIPMKRIRQGDPYRDEVEKCVSTIQKELGDIAWIHLSFQSKVGPVKWLEPATSDMIKDLARKDVKELWVYPLGFVADNSETIYEIDILYRQLAEQEGIKEYYCFEALNTNPLFIQALVEIIFEKYSQINVHNHTPI